MKNLKKILIESISNVLGPHGFKKCAPQRFTRRFEGGTYEVHITIVKHPNDYDVLIDLGIRFDAIESMISEDNQLDRSTLGIELGYLIAGEPLRWTVVDENDVKKTCKDICELYKEYCSDYFFTYSDLNNVYKLLSDPIEGPKHSPVHYLRLVRTIAIAILLSMDGLEKLVEIYKNIMAQKSKLENEWFLQILERMRGTP